MGYLTPFSPPRSSKPRHARRSSGCMTDQGKGRGSVAYTATVLSSSLTSVLIHLTSTLTSVLIHLTLTITSVLIRLTSSTHPLSFPSPLSSFLSPHPLIHSLLPHPCPHSSHLIHSSTLFSLTPVLIPITSSTHPFACFSLTSTLTPVLIHLIHSFTHSLALLFSHTNPHPILALIRL
ncbi:hypothetical protein Pcinc_037289 [Petrolisthes cinctipes]|uniref:Uncharacterized protein n=1 Tax=Petrolisthes cinctipes TaxID=88211 RepID=A0AAE1BT62_PETCI|nr:hypothetical protein Pcinc_037289 [Petrolisthes cinctipes]